MAKPPKPADPTPGLNLVVVLKEKFCLVYTCLHRACGLDFLTEDSIRSHIAEKHQTKDTAKDHKIEFKRSYKCLFDPKECGRKLETLNQIINHICKSHLSDTVQDGIDYRNICICPATGCALGFSDEKSLKQHKSAHRQQLPAPEVPSGESTQVATLEKLAAKKHQCEKCGSRFQRPSHLKKHLLIHDQNSLSKSQADKQPPRKPRKKQGKEYKCPHASCGKEFRNSSKLARHVRIHSATRSFDCPFRDCKAEFNRRDHLHAHLCLHKSMKQFSCPNRYCHSKFKYANNLRTHMKTHLRDKSRLSVLEDESMDSDSLLKRFKPDQTGRSSDDERTSEPFGEHHIDINSMTECSNSHFNSVEPETSNAETRPLDDEEREIFESLASVLRSHDFEDYSGVRSVGDSARNEHVINMNSDDEEYAASVVVLENLSGSARTDYRSNHFYINKNKQRCKKLKNDQLHTQTS